MAKEGLYCKNDNKSKTIICNLDSLSNDQMRQNYITSIQSIIFEYKDPKIKMIYQPSNEILVGKYTKIHMD